MALFITLPPALDYLLCSLKNLSGAWIHVRQAARTRPLRVGGGAVRRPQRWLLPSAAHHAEEGRQRQDGGH